jgi:hypothetical protein
MSPVMEKALLSKPLGLMLPTLTAFYANGVAVTELSVVPDMPAEAWARQVKHELLASSEDRRRNVEAKGTGLSALAAVIGAADLLVIINGWAESTLLGKVLVVVATGYALLSLIAPLYLVGAQTRETLHVREIKKALAVDDAEGSLADQAADGAMKNDLRTRQLTNLLDAARHELAYALFGVLLWAFLVPLTDLLHR